MENEKKSGKRKPKKGLIICAAVLVLGAVIIGVIVSSMNDGGDVTDPTTAAPKTDAEGNTLDPAAQAITLIAVEAPLTLPANGIPADKIVNDLAAYARTNFGRLLQGTAYLVLHNDGEKYFWSAFAEYPTGVINACFNAETGEIVACVNNHLGEKRLPFFESTGTLEEETEKQKNREGKDYYQYFDEIAFDYSANDSAAAAKMKTVAEDNAEHPMTTEIPLKLEEFGVVSKDEVDFVKIVTLSRENFLWSDEELPGLGGNGVALVKLKDGRYFNVIFNGRFDSVHGFVPVDSFNECYNDFFEKE